MIEPTLQLLNDHILVEFEEKPKLSEALDLVMPERYLIQDADKEGEHDAYGVVTDRRTINPQIVKVIQGNDTIPKGSRCFVHYGAFEVAKWYKPKQAIIRASMVFFMLDPIRPFEGNYLGEEIFVEGEKTESGIYLTPFAETKLPCNVKILHVPEPLQTKIKYVDSSSPSAYDGSTMHRYHLDEKWQSTSPVTQTINVGDEVISVDAANYTLKYQDKKYVRLKDSEIVAKIVDGEPIPLGRNILVEYMDEDLSELIAENDRRREAKDLAIKYRLHVPGIDYNPLPPPRLAPVKILAIGDIPKREFDVEISEEASVIRGKGVMLKDNKWIIGLDAIMFLHAKG